MEYSNAKWVGAVCWAFTYLFFVLIAMNHQYSMIPLSVCVYNISYELLYSIKSVNISQRARNGLWFFLDIFIVYQHLYNLNKLYLFIFLFIIFFFIQLILHKKINKSSVKGFAWFVTCLMSSILLYNDIPNGYLVALAVLFKSLGDGFYGYAHLKYGLPNKEKINCTYYKTIKLAIIFSFFLNFILLIKILSLSLNY